MKLLLSLIFGVIGCTATLGQQAVITNFPDTTGIRTQYAEYDKDTWLHPYSVTALPAAGLYSGALYTKSWVLDPEGGLVPHWNFEAATSKFAASFSGNIFGSIKSTDPVFQASGIYDVRFVVFYWPPGGGPPILLTAKAATVTVTPL